MGSKAWGCYLFQYLLLFSLIGVQLQLVHSEHTWVVPPFVFFNIIFRHISSAISIQHFSLQTTFSNLNSICQIICHSPLIYKAPKIWIFFLSMRNYHHYKLHVWLVLTSIMIKDDASCLIMKYNDVIK